MIRSTIKQVKTMRKKWPMFKVLHFTRWEVLWEGSLCPLFQGYTVQVLFQYQKNYQEFDPIQTPKVTVMNPLLHRRVEDPSDPIPHHYPNRNNPKLPILCLYDPDAREWHPGLLVAKTVIPWTIDWLACYEGWLATGEWTGGGRHA